MIDGVLTIRNYLASADVETTGTNAEQDRIWQIGVVRVNADGTVHEGSQYVNPTVEIPREIVENPKFNLTPDVLKEIYDAPTFAQLAPKVHKGLSEADCLVGFNIAFDVRFFSSEFKRVGLVFEPPPLLDAAKIYHHFFKRTLTAAVKEYLGEELEGAHDGLNDSRAALRVLVAQLKRHTELPRDIRELHKLFFEAVAPGNVDAAGKIIWKNGKPVLNFGKHQGKSLTDIEPPGAGRYSLRSYIEWAVSGDFPSDTKRVLQDALMGKFPLPPSKN